MFFTRLKTIIETTDTFVAKFFDLTIQALIFTSVLIFSLETVPGLKNYHPLFYKIEFTLVIIFTIEYLLRLLVATSRKKFIFSFYGVIDLLAILPFFISLGVIDLRVVRALRFLRIFRILKITRFTTATERLHAAFVDIKHELVVFSLLSLILIYLSACGIYFFEKDVQPNDFKSIFHAMWWAIATLSTVGYGDVYPVTTGGKIFTTFILFIGVSFVAIPSGLIASSLKKK